jgi:hypothetical protein
LVLLCLVPRLANSQLGASAAISLVARLPGTVTLRESVIPFSITTSGEEHRSTPVQLEVKWNLDPNETQSFRIVATLSPKLEAPAQLMVRIDNSEPRLFSTHARHVLFNVPIRLENRQGRQDHTLELLLTPAEETGLPTRDFRGILTLSIERQ